MALTIIIIMSSHYRDRSMDISFFRHSTSSGKGSSVSGSGVQAAGAKSESEAVGTLSFTP